MTVADVDIKRSAIAELAAVPVRVWGMTPAQLHDHLWAASGVQAVRRGSGQRVNGSTARYVLLDRGEGVSPDAGYAEAARPETRGWRRRRRSTEHLDLPEAQAEPQGISSPGDYRERVELDRDGRLVRVTRDYAPVAPARRSVRITEDRRVAAAWAADRASIPEGRASTASFAARSFQRGACADDMSFLGPVLDGIARSGAAPGGVCEIMPGVWADETASIEPGARVIAPVWIGRGAVIGAADTIVGPCAVPDGGAPPVVIPGLIRADKPDETTEPARGVWSERAKRAFDIGASLAVLVATLPVSVVIVAAIWAQAGRPIFFCNERQTIGGRRFRCWKFRTMRKDAEQIKAAFAGRNTCDGPQFHIPNDPRTFAVGRALRRCHLDELPQLINVLCGDMSIVGPRPSPDRENQYCPPWREARLSVRAGITGLWQVRCRRRPGTDFQEWIRYDLEYVRAWSWAMDVGIMWRTLFVALRRGAGMVLPAHPVSEMRTPKAAVYTPERTRALVEPKPEASGSAPVRELVRSRV